MPVERKAFILIKCYQSCVSSRNKSSWNTSYSRFLHRTLKYQIIFSILFYGIRYYLIYVCVCVCVFIIFFPCLLPWVFLVVLYMLSVIPATIFVTRKLTQGLRHFRGGVSGQTALSNVSWNSHRSLYNVFVASFALTKYYIHSINFAFSHPVF